MDDLRQSIKVLIIESLNLDSYNFKLLDYIA